MLRRIAFDSSIWLVPMQKAPMPVSLGALARTSAVSCVRERKPRKWASAMRAASSSPVRAEGRDWTWV
jgi:hypothetical protein